MMERARAVVLGAGFPLALIVLWHAAVVSSGTKLVPTPLMVGTTIVELAGVDTQARAEMGVLNGGKVIDGLL